MAKILIGNIKPTLINNALTTQAGVAALDAAMGKTLQDQISQQSSDMNEKVDSSLFSVGRFFITFDNSLDLDSLHTDSRLTFSGGYGGYVIMRNSEMIIGYTDKGGLYSGQFSLTNGKIRYRSKYNNSAFSDWADK